MPNEIHSFEITSQWMVKTYMAGYLNQYNEKEKNVSTSYILLSWRRSGALWEMWGRCDANLKKKKKTNEAIIGSNQMQCQGAYKISRRTEAER